MKIDWKKVAAFFGIPEATEAEVDARLDEELASRKDAEKAPEARDKGEDAGAAEGKEAVAAATDTPTLSAADVTALVTAAVTAAIKPLNDRLAVVEGADAAEETGGSTEAAETNDSAPIYTQNPINTRVAAKLAGNK
jgi:hypothetical protein